MNKKNKPHIVETNQSYPNLIEGLISILRNKIKEMNLTNKKSPEQARTIIKEITKWFMAESDVNSTKNRESVQDQKKTLKK
jgi:hypothetical protein